MSDRSARPMVLIAVAAIALAVALFAVAGWLRPAAIPPPAQAPSPVAGAPRDPVSEPRPGPVSPVRPAAPAPAPPRDPTPAPPPPELRPWEERLTAAMVEVHGDLQACLPEPADPSAPPEPVAAIFDIDTVIGGQGSKPDNIRFNNELPVDSAACLREVLDGIRFEDGDVRTGQTFVILPP